MNTHKKNTGSQPDGSPSAQNAAGSAHLYRVGEIAFAFDPCYKQELPSLTSKDFWIHWRAAGRGEFVWVVEGPHRTNNDSFYRVLVMRDDMSHFGIPLQPDEEYGCRFNPHRVVKLWAEFPVSQDQMIPTWRNHPHVQPSRYFVKKVLSARTRFIKSPPALDEKNCVARARWSQNLKWLTLVVDRRRLAP